MSRSFFGAALLCSALATLIGGSALAAQPQRARLSLDAGWRFHLGDFSETHTGASITPWRWKADPQGTADWSLQSAPALDPRADGWQDASPGQDTFGGKPGYNWYVTDLNDIPVPGRSVHFESVDDDGVVFLNGKRLTAHRGWNDPFDVPLASAWNARGPNRLVVLVQNETGPGSIGAAYSETLTTAGPAAGSNSAISS